MSIKRIFSSVIDLHTNVFIPFINIFIITALSIDQRKLNHSSRTPKPEARWLLRIVARPQTIIEICLDYDVQIRCSAAVFSADGVHEFLCKDCFEYSKFVFAVECRSLGRVSLSSQSLRPACDRPRERISQPARFGGEESTRASTL